MQITSLQTYYSEVLPNLSDRQQQIIDALKYIGNFTNKELSEFLEWDINRITPRVNELVKLGIICEKGKRKCKYTGRTAIECGLAERKVRNYEYGKGKICKYEILG